MYFGTDGIRGLANKELTALLAHSCGNALVGIKSKARIVIGRDTRQSGNMIALALASGVMQGGGDVIDVGIIPTAGVAFLTKLFKADFGIVVSASHNPSEYNGIKVFDCDGFKLNEQDERAIELQMSDTFSVPPDQIGSYTFLHNSIDSYFSSLVKSGSKLNGLSVLLDCSNGAAFEVAPRVFDMLGASVVAINTESNGKNINNKAGALHANLLCEKVVAGKFDVGFAYDGDSDRLIAVDEKGNIIDGDKILYILATEMLAHKQLEPKIVVGTAHTNIGVEKMLREKGIQLVRADIGDKYVIEQMRSTHAKLGGEQSGHIILSDYSTTGDGILSSVVLASTIVASHKTLSQLNTVKSASQSNLNIPVRDKIRILNNESLNRKIDEVRATLGVNGRVLVRASGTEEIIRVMVESIDEQCETGVIASSLSSFIRSI
ncbi:MAG: phosphoglucosamine mutase [Clostridia bacterium]